MDPRDLKSAATYVNNLLSARGLLRGTDIDFARPTKDPETPVRIINLVHELIQRRDKDSEQRETLATTIRTLRSDAQKQLDAHTTLKHKLAESERRAALLESQLRAQATTLRTVESSTKTLKDEALRLKTLLAQVRTQHANELRKRDLHIQKMKERLLDSRRGGRPGPSTIVVSGGARTRSAARADSPPAQSLAEDTTEYLTDLSQSLADENDALLALLRSCLAQLKSLCSLPEDTHSFELEENGEAMVVAPPAKCEQLEREIEEVMGSLNEMLNQPDYVPIQEMEERDEMIRALEEERRLLGERCQTLEEEWRKALELVDGWNRRLAEGVNGGEGLKLPEIEEEGLGEEGYEEAEEERQQEEAADEAEVEAQPEEVEEERRTRSRAKERRKSSRMPVSWSIQEEDEGVQEEIVVAPPVDEEPVEEEPVEEEPVEEHVEEEPVADEPAEEEPVEQEPLAEDPTPEDPVPSEPSAQPPHLPPPPQSPQRPSKKPLHATPRKTPKARTRRSITYAFNTEEDELQDISAATLEEVSVSARKPAPRRTRKSVAALLQEVFPASAKKQPTPTPKKEKRRARKSTAAQEDADELPVTETKPKRRPRKSAAQTLQDADDAEDISSILLADIATTTRRRRARKSTGATPEQELPPAASTKKSAKQKRKHTLAVHRDDPSPEANNKSAKKSARKNTAGMPAAEEEAEPAEEAAEDTFMHLFSPVARQSDDPEEEGDSITVLTTTETRAPRRKSERKQREESEEPVLRLKKGKRKKEEEEEEGMGPGVRKRRRSTRRG